MTTSSRSRLLAFAMLTACICAPASAGNSSATFQVGLTIVSSCAIATTTAAPVVSCTHAEPYRLDVAPQQAREDGVWTVTF